MAKLKLTQAEVREMQEVRTIRSRFAEAQRLGYSNAEAAKLAHGAGKITPPGGRPPAPEPQPKPVAARVDDPPATQTLSLSGGVQQPEQTHPDVDIPPNWEDLPWPQLKSLAERLNGGRDVKSRKLANETIENALNRGFPS